MYIIRQAGKVTDVLDTLVQKVQKGNANVDEQKLYRKLGKTLKLLAENPRHPGLASHKILELKGRYRRDDIWESYVENHTSGARRIFWRYGPGPNEITLLALELHPENALSYRQIASEAKRAERP